MTTITNKENEILIQGHSEYSEYGKDIVCASISSIAYTTISACKRWMNESVEIEDLDDYILIKVVKRSPVINTLIDNMIDMFKELEKEYSNNVRMCII